MVTMEMENDNGNEISDERDDGNEISDERDNGNEISDEMDNGNEISDEREEVPNLGLADVMNKILMTNKPRKKKTIVLAKAKKLSAKQVIEPPKDKEQLPNKQLKPCDWIVKGRMKPNALERNYEKRLMKITVSGVVNLFNAVNQCKIKNGKSDTLLKKDFKLIDKNKFLGILLNGNASSKDNSEHNDNENEMDVDKKHDNVTWDVLKKDFGGDTKWRNWDQTLSNKS